MGKNENLPSAPNGMPCRFTLYFDMAVTYKPGGGFVKLGANQRVGGGGGVGGGSGKSLTTIR